MESNCYRVNITKWLPFPDSKLESWFKDIVCFNYTTRKLARDMGLIIEELQQCTIVCDDKALNDPMLDQLETIIQNYKTIYSSKKTFATNQIVYNYKSDHLLSIMKRLLNTIAKFIYIFINQTLDWESDELTLKFLRLIKIYIDALSLENSITESSINIFSNDCPSMLESLKPLSVLRILQILGKNKAEEYSYELIDCLLAIYQPNNQDKCNSSASGDLEMSENSSVEIYRALTKHITPPGSTTNAASRRKCSNTNIESFQALVNNQKKKLQKFIQIAKEISPLLFHTDSFRYDKQGKIIKIRSSILARLSDYYCQVCWAAISEILDHVILWWSAEGLATRHNHGAHYLKDWLHSFLLSPSNVPVNIRPTLDNLCDTLGCHVTTTCWDELFRLAYIASFECASRPHSSEGTDTGQMFAQVFQLLVNLSNECEISGEWVVGAPLMELPLSEQIIILHRLDHSIHTMRLWASHESKIIAHTWDLESFFLLVKGDLSNCINQISYLKLADHTAALNTDNPSVQVYVCTRMRAKIVSEVNANFSLLKESSSKCISTLAKICRVISLANLHMCFPISNIWRRSSIVSNINPSPYVQVYLERVLLPVLEVVEDEDISNMVLKIMCEAWLDYIYLHRIKFSEPGAYQLLSDFAYVSQWVTNCPIISQNVKDQLLKNEVLRRCEGVGRLLLRHPGEAIAMHKKIRTRSSDNGSPESLGLERMPAEMYVPNQEQWLELRAEKNYKLYCCVE
ncbi:uncharacterized protein LOC130677689 [Microplitis mediator]|uniref:uncharacterized protein LOC130677689 n=1 Tax=Microplitis mediator TaxID=375433 RepID=UPI0025566CC9|nr:uncharacterized protein LOC130677689 [Microplitis mediator]